MPSALRDGFRMSVAFKVQKTWPEPGIFMTVMPWDRM